MAKPLTALAAGTVIYAARPADHRPAHGYYYYYSTTIVRRQQHTVRAPRPETLLPTDPLSLWKYKKRDEYCL